MYTRILCAISLLIIINNITYNSGCHECYCELSLNLVYFFISNNRMATDIEFFVDIQSGVYEYAVENIASLGGK